MNYLKELTLMVEENKRRKQREEMVRKACKGPAMCCGAPTDDKYKCRALLGCRETL